MRAAVTVFNGRKWHCGCAQLPWMRGLRVGDVIESRAGTQRIVRALTRRKNGDLHSVDLAIRNCSWTGRAYTVLTYNDLIQMGYRKVRAKRRRLNTKFDRELLRNICNTDCRTLDCCDVKGVP